MRWTVPKMLVAERCPQRWTLSALWGLGPAAPSAQATPVRCGGWEHRLGRSRKTRCTSFGGSEQVTETSVPMWPLEKLSWGNSVGILWSIGGGRKYSPPLSTFLASFCEPEKLRQHPSSEGMASMEVGDGYVGVGPGIARLAVGLEKPEPLRAAGVMPLRAAGSCPGLKSWPDHCISPLPKRDSQLPVKFLMRLIAAPVQADCFVSRC